MAEVNTTQIRDALAWATDKPERANEPSDNPWVWFWEAIEGDFNENRSAKQIVMDAAISMIPLVDQICDARDLIANCKKLYRDSTDTWAWVALALTLIGLFPTLGSLVKGVLKIFFLFVRRSGGDSIAKAVELAITWVVSFLRRRDVQKYLRVQPVDEVLSWLAREFETLRGRVNVHALLDAFDFGIQVLEGLVNKVSLVPSIGRKAMESLEQVRKIRLAADKRLAEAVKPVIHVLDSIIMRLKREALEHQHGIVNANNVHFRGALPEAVAVTLMRREDQLQPWLNKGKETKWPSENYAKKKTTVDDAVKDGWPNLSQQNVESFYRLDPFEIQGPAVIFRIVAPTSRGMSDCWISAEVFEKLQRSPDPRTAWRKYLAVWPDWNVNGQFVTYEVKPGEKLKVWRGPASSQQKKALKDLYLEGGWEQIVFNVARGDKANDTMRYYKLKGGEKNRLRDALSQEEYDKLSKEVQAQYTSLREAINHPNISGPFETGWGYTDFAGEGFLSKVGLPSLPGQTTRLID